MQNSFIKRLVPNLIPGIACMLLMCQAYLVVPLQPALTKEFNSLLLNMAIPAFIIPFAIAGIVMGFCRHSIKPEQSFLISLVIMSAGTLLLSTVTSASLFILIRVLTGLGTGLMLPLALILVTKYGDKRGWFANMVTMIFALATGVTFGPGLGGWLNGLFGWRLLYLAISILAALLLLFYFLSKKQSREDRQHVIKLPGASNLVKRNKYIYTFAYLTGVFHSGVFVWIGNYFATHYVLDEFNTANTLSILGVPGLITAIFMFCYKLDKKVIKILYAGFALTFAGIIILATDVPLFFAQCLLVLISIGFSCTQPLFIGILKMPARQWYAVRPIAIGSGILFAGYGSGPLIMIALPGTGSIVAICFFAGLIIAMCIVSQQIWKAPPPERRHSASAKSRGKDHLINA